MYKNLKTLRESLDMTQKEFAASLGIGYTTYNGYETGAREPKSDFLLKVATEYGVTIDYLLGFSNDPHRTTQEKPAPSGDELLDAELISRLASLTPEEMQKVDAFVQGLLANR